MHGKLYTYMLKRPGAMSSTGLEDSTTALTGIGLPQVPTPIYTPNMTSIITPMTAGTQNCLFARYRGKAPNDMGQSAPYGAILLTNIRGRTLAPIDVFQEPRKYFIDFCQPTDVIAEW